MRRPTGRSGFRPGTQHDLNLVLHHALYMCSADEEVEAYIEWQRQRVLNYTGRSMTIPAKISSGASCTPSRMRHRKLASCAGAKQRRCCRPRIVPGWPTWGEEALRSDTCSRSHQNDQAEAGTGADAVPLHLFDPPTPHRASRRSEAHRVERWVTRLAVAPLRRTSGVRRRVAPGYA